MVQEVSSPHIYFTYSKNSIHLGSKDNLPCRFIHPIPIMIQHQRQSCLGGKGQYMPSWEEDKVQIYMSTLMARQINPCR